MVLCTTVIKDTHMASLYELAFTATRSVSGQSCEVKKRRAPLVAGWVTQALEQGRQGSCAHAGYRQYYNCIQFLQAQHTANPLSDPKSLTIML